jgi:hypothetical protein
VAARKKSNVVVASLAVGLLVLGSAIGYAISTTTGAADATTAPPPIVTARPTSDVATPVITAIGDGEGAIATDTSQAGEGTARAEGRARTRSARMTRTRRSGPSPMMAAAPAGSMDDLSPWGWE